MSEQQCEDLKTRLMSRTLFDPVSGCLNWTGAINAQGYGHIRIGKQVYRTHRVAWELEHGPAPKDLLLCHRCANRACCNVQHLYLGDHQTNADDRVADGHSARKLSDRDVAAIIGMVLGGQSKKATAKAFGVSKSTVGLIVQGTSRRGALWREAEKSLDLDADSDDHGEVFPLPLLDPSQAAPEAA